MIKHKFFRTFLFLILITSSVSAQILKPIKWTFSQKHLSNNEFAIIFKAEIEKNWYLYDMTVTNGPIPTSFTFEESPSYSVVKEVVGVSSPVLKHDGAFNLELNVYLESAEFEKIVRVSQYPAKVTGYVSFMSCDGTQCIPPDDVEFEIVIEKPTVKKKEVTEKAGEKSENQQSLKEQVEELSAENEPVKVEEEEEDLLQTTSAEPILVDSSKDASGNKGLLIFFILSLFAGFAGVLTPCVFPMIPMTVAFFSQGKSSKSFSAAKVIVFGLTIVLLYSSLGIIVSLTSAGSGFANTLSTHWIPNLLFFVLFLVFASSFFGAFEIMMPNSWISSADSKVDKGGILASFFMGLTTVLVSFSCTGPIVGALLVEAASGDVLRPTIGMFGFGFAFAIPFTLLAFFPSVMNKLPKSGGWLNSIKVVLAFIMLAFSLKFISTIDNVYNLGLLSRDVFLSIWIVLFVLTGLYLMGKLKFGHDSEVKHIGVVRLFFIIASFSFSVYLVPGLFGAPLTGISSLLPSRSKSTFDLEKMIGENQTGHRVKSVSSICDTPKYGDFLHLSNNLEGYFDLEQGLACAREQGKPVLLDFTGHACSNCKAMEARVFSDPEVQKIISENFVLIALYTDDRTTLPEEDWFVSEVDGKVKKTLGKVNEDYQISHFNTNALPYYVITDQDGNALNKPISTTLDIGLFKAWLQEGLSLSNK
jgi:thiol:disulfide interchange protein